MLEIEEKKLDELEKKSQELKAEELCKVSEDLQGFYDQQTFGCSILNTMEFVP